MLIKGHFKKEDNKETFENCKPRLMEQYGYIGRFIYLRGGECEGVEIIRVIHVRSRLAVYGF